MTVCATWRIAFNLFMSFFLTRSENIVVTILSPETRQHLLVSKFPPRCQSFTSNVKIITDGVNPLLYTASCLERGCKRLCFSVFTRFFLYCIRGYPTLADPETRGSNSHVYRDKRGFRYKRAESRCHTILLYRNHDCSPAAAATNNV
ncbi:unnamed protein product, partial [Ectocarpus sp. 12 AP-2014]